MTAFYFNYKKYGPVPESYNELSGKQLIGIAGLFLKEMKQDEARLSALKVLLNKSFFGFTTIPADAKARMLQYIEWVFEKNTLTNQVLPSYRGFEGPKKEFDNLTLSEFHFAERYYQEVVTSLREGTGSSLRGGTTKQSPNALDQLVAILYRKPKPGYNYDLDSDGDARQRFNANEIDHYAAVISYWPAAVKQTVLFFYDGCRQYLLDLYDEVFSGNSGEENEDGMFGIIRGISGDKYGDIDKVEMLNIHTALSELTIQLKEAKQLSSAPIP